MSETALEPGDELDEPQGEGLEDFVGPDLPEEAVDVADIEEAGEADYGFEETLPDEGAEAGD